MSDYADLVRRLSVYGDGLCKEAADAIEALASQAASREELRQRFERACGALTAKDTEIEELRAQLAVDVDTICRLQDGWNAARAQLAAPLPEEVEKIVYSVVAQLKENEQPRLAEKLDSAVRSLARQVAQLRSSRNDLVDSWNRERNVILRRLGDAEAERDAYRKDAERYRWLAADGDRAVNLLNEYSGYAVETLIDAAIATKESK